jgi:hypothetical protein
MSVANLAVSAVNEEISEMEEPILRPLFEAFFTAFPTGFFLQILNGFAELINLFFGLFGIQSNVSGF